MKREGRLLRGRKLVHNWSLRRINHRFVSTVHESGDRILLCSWFWHMLCLSKLFRRVPFVVPSSGTTKTPPSKFSFQEAADTS